MKDPLKQEFDVNEDANAYIEKKLDKMEKKRAEQKKLLRAQLEKRKEETGEEFDEQDIED